ncbi:V-type ATPase subunit D [Spraguea lophii 42_110]|uniref:V-type ATPase subunit D n=1 Tax=Spraguea lophii (strain 42_110) TaxID=1358809 RepID=S7WCW9_SPRLO|nr:V-type ATPase subunit D [Spraguea lophii 42_110]
MLNLKAADDSLVDEIGYFQELETLKFSNNMEDVYKFCIEPTFLKNLFDKIQYVNDIKQNNLQIMEAEIRKIHTNNFYMKITHNMDHMKNILKAEGTRYLVELVINSLSSIKGEDRKKFLPQITKFTTGDINALSLASSLDDIKNIIRIDGNEDQILNKLLSKEIDEYLFSFNKFNDISTVYAYFKLKEREIQNILWILECIRHEKKEYAGNIVKVNG